MLVAQAVRCLTAMRPGRNQPACGLQAHQAIAGGGDADGPTAVSGVCGRQHAAGHGCTRHRRWNRPAMCARFQGLRVGPVSAGSVEALMPNSGDAVRPRITKTCAPQARYGFAVEVMHITGKQAAAMRERHAATGACRSLMR